jgi:4-amino-4-deoxy-L-arabinose transferase-like glycosyltransferase
MDQLKAISTPDQKQFIRSPLFINLALVLLLLLGLGIRLYDLTDPPLDFHPTRQLLSAIIARGMYYQMNVAADPEVRALALDHWASIEAYEPPIFNRLVAVTYLLAGGEHLWIARIYSTLFWLVGGVALFFLASRIGSSRSALIAFAYYLFLPFAVYTSRSFQVDPLMVMFIMLSAYALYRWLESSTWRWAIAAGVLGGLTILVKVTAGLPVIAMAVAVTLTRLGVRRSWRDSQVWLMAILMVVPASSYYLVGLSGRSAEYFSFWTLSMGHLLLDPSFFVRWMSFVHRLVDLSLLVISLVGLLLAASTARPFLLSLWVGYLIYGSLFPFQIRTHDYYHLMLVPIMALSATPLIETVLDRLARQPRRWQLAFLGLAILSIAYPLWVTRSALLVSSYRHEPAIYLEIGETIPRDGNIIALTHDYGYRLMYYGWRKPSQLWPVEADLEVAALRGSDDSARGSFEARTSGMRYFLVTLGSELDSQTWLKEILYGTYAIQSQGDGYVVFDLERPVESSP